MADLKSTKKARPRLAEKVARRVARFQDAPPEVEGVTPLATGFFFVERMRGSRTAKRRQAA